MEKFFKSKLFYYLAFAALGFIMRAAFGFEWAVITMMAWILGDINYLSNGKN